METGIAVVNCGSTSLKFAIYTAGSNNLRLLYRGMIDSMQTDPHLVVKDKEGKPLGAHEWGEGHAIDHGKALAFAFEWCEKHLPMVKLIAVGHRVVLGGERFHGPVLIDGDVLDYLASLAAVEPSHQPYEVAAARAIAGSFPGLHQVACFDTSFHRTMPEIAQIYAVPQELRKSGVHHWGFHGISYDYISRQMPKYVPSARRVIAAHLGGGASMCAMLDGKSIETSMGMAAISGLPMTTRCGDIPPDVLFYLLRSKLYDDASLEKILYQNSGLLGLSETSGDMRELENNDDPRAKLAFDYFVYSIVKYAGAYTSVLGGLDALVFTAGIGENSAEVRAAVCEKLSWLGVSIDPAANKKNGPLISAKDSDVSVWVIPTDEELMIAMHTRALAAPNKVFC
ncbi:MAG: acetate/propionate family kinase [Rhodomicrobium sp.]